jgi:pyridoxal phosphate enzyme (YggS family)
MTDRRDEIAANLAGVRQRIEVACREAGREPAEVTLVVVTKFFPVSDVRILAELGVTDIGENRHQEAEAKVAECGDLDLRWHFVGGLQSNKAAAVASYSDVVESVERRKLVRRLNEGAHGRSRPVDCLIQVSLDEPGAEGRSGADPDDVPALADEVDSAGMLHLRGLMAVAPLGVDPRGPYRRLAELRADFVSGRPEATWLSAGMSADLEEAIGAGATHVRVGTAILGSRPQVQ